MQGIVYAINYHRGMVAVLTDGSDFSIFELTGRDNIDVGDEVYWQEDTSLGFTMLTNRTKSDVFEVYFQNHWVPEHLLKAQLLME